MFKQDTGALWFKSFQLPERYNQFRVLPRHFDVQTRLFTFKGWPAQALCCTVYTVYVTEYTLKYAIFVLLVKNLIP